MAEPLSTTAPTVAVTVAPAAPQPQPLVARPLQFRGSRLARWLLARLGWSVRFDGLPQRRGVVVVYPHTSNWDFVIAVLAKWATGIPASFLGKDSLFKWPLFGRFVRAIGGIPVDRSGRQGLVGAMVEQFDAARRDDRVLWVGLAPEGTRRWAPGWRSGFYRVARGAGVPVGVASFDYATRVFALEHFIVLCGDEEADMAALARTVAHCHACRPEGAAPVKLLS